MTTKHDDQEVAIPMLERYCWGVGEEGTWRGSARCPGPKREGFLTCRKHAHLEVLARALEHKYGLRTFDRDAPAPDPDDVTFRVLEGGRR